MIFVSHHYWIVAGSATEVYSGASNTLVPVADSTYSDWAQNNTAAPIASEAELADALRANGSQLPAWIFNAASFIQPSPGAYSKSQLAAYSADARYRHASGGVTIGGKPYLTDPVARNTVASAHDYAVANPGHVTDWKLADGTFTQLTEAQLATVLQEMATFVQACFTCESTTLAGINSGTVTTIAAIDAAYAAVSNVLA
jgi:Domain of unknown function (DUF4376)